MKPSPPSESAAQAAGPLSGIVPCHSDAHGPRPCSPAAWSPPLPAALRPTGPPARGLYLARYAAEKPAFGRRRSLPAAPSRNLRFRPLPRTPRRVERTITNLPVRAECRRPSAEAVRRPSAWAGANQAGPPRPLRRPSPEFLFAIAAPKMDLCPAHFSQAALSRAAGRAVGGRSPSRNAGMCAHDATGRRRICRPAFFARTARSCLCMA